MIATVETNGTVTCLYTEEIQLKSVGKVSLRRASCVEPLGDQWTADMAPVGGPLLGPFDERSQALAAEVLWLEQNLLGDPANE